MDVGSSFKADAQPSELVKPGDGALDDPARAALLFVLWFVALCEIGLDSLVTQFLAVRFAVVGSVPFDALGSESWRPNFAAHGGNPLQQGFQLRDVMHVCARE